MNIPRGKGMYLWNISEVAKGVPADIAAHAVQLKLDWVAIKLTDGISPFARRRNMLGQWVDDILQPVVDALEGSGVKIWWWTYSYLNMWDAEVTCLVNRIGKYGKKEGLIIDAEKEVKGRPAQAESYMRGLRKALGNDYSIGFSSYKYPNSHMDYTDGEGNFYPGVPWKIYAIYCDWWQPQVYWVSHWANQGAAYQLQRSIDQYKALRDLPMVPAGCLYPEGTWKPTQTELAEFYALVAKLKLPAWLYWSWEHLEKYLPYLTGEVSSQSSDYLSPVDPPPAPSPGIPPVLTLEELTARLMALEHWAGTHCKEG